MSRPTEAGRDLDAEVAAKVMGLSVCDKPRQTDLPERCNMFSVPDHLAPDDLLMPHYSTDFAEAWQVVERFPRFVVSKFPGYTRCYVWREWEQDDLGSVTASSTVRVEDAETAPLAICRAALAAVSRSSAESDAASPAGQA